MKKLVIISPGQQSDWVRLVDVQREAHDEERNARTKEIERRKRFGIPLDDDTDWTAVDAAVAKRDSALVARLTLGHAIEPLPEFEADEILTGVEVRFIAISEGERRRLSFAHASAVDALTAAGTKAADVLAACDARDAAMADWLSHAVAAVRIDGVEVDVDATNFAASGLLAPLFAAARDYQRLSPGKGTRFGWQPPST
ncbi:MAG: hypothetical protein ACK52I_01615 [Pseudomonadota bacterium]|jgi:hypothetical protein